MRDNLNLRQQRVDELTFRMEAACRSAARRPLNARNLWWLTCNVLM